MGNIMILQELFQQLLRYHLLEDNSCMEEIQRGLERKLDSLVLHELYGKYKTAPTQEEREKADRNIWTGKVCRTDFDGNSSLTDIDGSVTRSCREADKEEARMIIQPDREKWNVNDIRYKNEARRIAVLNEIFGDVELSTEEMRTMIWLAGWEDSTVENVVSAIRKAMAADVRRRELPLRP